MSKVLQAAKGLKRDYAKLQQRNEELTAELADVKEQLEADVQPKRGSRGKGPSVGQLQKKVVELQGRVRELEKVSTKQQ